MGQGEQKLAIIVDKIKLAYFPAPKVACTSLKLMFYQVENGRNFEKSIINGEVFHIHHHYPAIRFDMSRHERMSGLERVCVVRDPVSRFISSYTNRVIFHGELDESRLPAKAIAKGAKPRPSLEEYVERIELYRKYSKSIRWHTEPQVTFYGGDKRYFQKVYGMSELESFRGYVSERLGEEVELPHAQSGGPKISKEDLSSNAMRKIREMYSEDYDVFQRF